MPIDTSMYTVQPVDPLQRINNLIGLQNNALALKGAQQQYEARGALGSAYQNAINPETGDIDTNKLITAVGQDPRLAWQAESIVQNVLARQKAQADVQKQRLDIALEANKGMNGIISGLLADPDVSADKARSAISDAQTRGYITPTQAAQQMKSIPDNPVALKNWINGHFLENATVGERLQALKQTQTINAGGTTQLVSVSPLTGQVQSLGQIRNTPTPGEMLPYQAMTQSQKADIALRGAEPVTLPTGGGGTQVFTKGALARTGGVGQTPEGVQPIAESATPGFIKGQEVAAEGSAKSLQTLRDQAAQSGEQMFILNQASRALESGITTGKGREAINGTVNFLNANLGLNINPEGVKNFEELNKYLVQNATREAGSLGAGTDQKLAAAFSGNPNTSLSTLTNKEILEANKGLLKYRQAMALASQQDNVQPDRFSDWQTTFAKQVPVEAFVWSSMSAEQRRKFAEKLDDNQRAQFKQTLEWAKTNGLY